MRFLGIDTSAGCALGLVDYDSASNRGQVLAEAYSTDGRAHAEQLSPLLARMVGEAGFKNLQDAQLDYIAVGRGPAPFTGLRAGLVVAKTLGHALGVPVIGVCSLAALAQSVSAGSGETVLITADARRKELYAAAYYRDEVGALVEAMSPAVDKPAVFAELAKRNSWQVVGVGPQLYPEQISGFSASTSVKVADLVQLAAQNLQARDLSPLYLRRPDIHQG